MHNEIYPGSIISRTTLIRLINNNELGIAEDDKAFSYEYLSENNLIDETSIDLHIGELFRISSSLNGLDILGKYDTDENYEKYYPEDDGSIILQPRDFLLGKTKESITTPPTILGMVEEKRTSAGNLGLMIKGFIPPGLQAEQTRFTITNLGSLPVRIYIGKIPPMKVLFYSLTSGEVYREGREARVSSDQIYSSGAGVNSITQLEVVFAEISIQNNPHFPNNVDINFQIRNCSTKTINQVQIFPLLAIDDFYIKSCSHGWNQMNDKCDKLDRKFSRKLLKNKSNAHCVYTETEISPSETIKGTFRIKLKNESKKKTFKCDVVCETKSGSRITVQYINEFPGQINTEDATKKWERIKDGFFDIIITTALVILIQKYGDAIINSITEFLKQLLDIAG